MQLHPESSPPEFFIFSIVLAVFLGVAVFLIDVLFAIGITRDGDRIRERGGETRFVGPTVWGLAVLVGSFLVVALYWLVHHSNLRAAPDQSVR